MRASSQSPAQKVHTVRARAVGGRAGTVRTPAGTLSFRLTPDELTQSQLGTNPEELFACSYASCFSNAVAAAAQWQGLKLPPVAVMAEVDLNRADEKNYSLSVTLDVSLPQLDQVTAKKLVTTAHEICPYSRAMQGNIDITLKVNQEPLAAAS